MQPSHIQSSSQGSVSVLSLAKESLAAINENTCGSGPSPLVAELTDEFVHAIQASPHSIVIDIRDLSFLDHANVAFLFKLVRLLGKNNKRGCICCSSNVKQGLDVVGMTKLCPTVADLDKAIAALASSSK